jgi:biopolymer transport protein ExbD
MAKRKKNSAEGAIEVDMTPMIDIVFQLIAFFMVITNFEQTQADERVKLPRDALAKPPEVKPDDSLTLNIGYIRDMQGNREDEEPWLFNFGGEDQVRPLNCQDMLDREARLYQGKEVDPKTVTIKIRADAEVPTGIVQRLIELCQKSGFEKFAMSAMSGEQE